MSVRGVVLLLLLVGCGAPGWTQRFVEHDGVRVEYLVRPGRGHPVVFVPGMAVPAAAIRENTALVAAVGDRTVVAISIRGRGASASPRKGWTVAAQASDIAAVVEVEHLSRYHLVAHSMGVGYALHHALAHPSSVTSFTAADYHPGLPAISEAWVRGIESKPAPVRFDRAIARRMLGEHTPYAPSLTSFDVPTLAILGTASADRSLEDEWMLAPRARVRWIEHGHDTFESEEARAALAAHLAAAER